MGDDTRPLALTTSRVYRPSMLLERPSTVNVPSSRADTPSGKYVEPSFDQDIVAPLPP